MSYQIIQPGTSNTSTVNPKIVGSIQPPDEKKDEITTKRISKKQIINLLNYINFQDETVTVNLRNTRFDNLISLRAKPHPCAGDVVFCEWVDPSDAERKINRYAFESVNFINDNKSLIISPAVVNIDEFGLRLAFSELYYPLQSEDILHHPCEGIKAQLIQNSVIFKGVLTDFSSSSFHVNITLEPPQTSQWINPEASVEVILSDASDTLYTGKCVVSESFFERNYFGLELIPKSQKINRFKQKKFRSQRESIIPAPNVMFKHPMTGKIIELKVMDISGSGFSVEGGIFSAILFPGMIISSIVMSFTKRFNLTLKAQVIYRQKLEPGENGTNDKIGMAIIDIDSESHNSLMGILHQTQDENSYINNEIDLDELWDFFFESGFIYPEKYKFLKEHREEVKRTFETIYSRGDDVARHFVFQKQGQIHSHMSTVRFYDKSWLIHHHAARRSSLNSGGLSVLNQIGRFINDSHRLYTTKMDYVFCYFRHENKFPNRVFGGASRIIKDQKACSLDSFAYFHLSGDEQNEMVPLGWELVHSDPDDLSELEAFYNANSNGLMINALELTPKNKNLEDISQAFEKINLKRDRHIYSLKKNGSIKAIIVINTSNIGLNLSDLTNSTTVCVLDSNELPFKVLKQSISILTNNLSMPESPILLYPVEYLNDGNIPFERTYDLWILNMNNTDNYFKYLKRLLRFVQY